MFGSTQALRTRSASAYDGDVSRLMHAQWPGSLDSLDSHRFEEYADLTLLTTFVAKRLWINLGVAAVIVVAAGFLLELAQLRFVAMRL